MRPSLSPPLQQVDRTFVMAGRRRLSYFSGCDYFRLSSHPKVLQAVNEGMRRFGLNVAASRLTTGNHVLYDELEERLCDFFNAEEALLLPSGYCGASVAAQSLAGQFSHALVDSRAHAALIDAAVFLECPVLRFQHGNVEGLKQVVSRCGQHARVILLTDGMFSHDGSVAPLRLYRQALPKDAWLLVDDAHGAGVLGETGKGSLEHAGVSRYRTVQCVTLSKALGVYGGALLCSKSFRTGVIKNSRQFTGTTPIPLPLVNGAIKSIGLLANDPGFRVRLRNNANFVKESLIQAGLNLPSTPGPIIRIVPRSTSAAKQVSAALLRAGVFPLITRYLDRHTTGYFRWVISSEHTRSQLEVLCKVLGRHAALFET